jgi:threonyl-tRNA synthetase
VDASDNRMQNKIRLAQEQKIPYMLVLGDREIEARTVALRARSGVQDPGVGWDELVERLVHEDRERLVG